MYSITSHIKKTSCVLFIGIGLAGSVMSETIALNADRAARMALEASALVSAATSRSDAARANEAFANAQLNPKLSLEGSLARRSSVPEFLMPLDGPTAPPVMFYPSIETTWSARIAVSQALYTGGTITNNRLASSSELASSKAQEDRLALDIEYQARLTYWNSVATKAALAASKTVEKRAKRLYEDAQALNDAGMAVAADVLAAESRLAMTQVEIIELERAADDAIATLRSLLGLGGSIEIALEDQAEKEVPNPRGELPKLLELAIENRPELDGLRSQATALAHRADAIDGTKKPAVALNGDWTYARPNIRYFPLEDSANDSWSVNLLASWTFYDGGRRSSEASILRHQQKAVNAEQEEVIRVILLEVENSHRQLESALASVRATDLAFDAAQAREQASQERYESGLAQVSEVLDAQTELAEAELGQIRARIASWIAATRLDRAVNL